MLTIADLIASIPRTQARQAADLRISPHYLSAIMRGRATPSADLAHRMATYYTTAERPLYAWGVENMAGDGEGA